MRIVSTLSAVFVCAFIFATGHAHANTVTLDNSSDASGLSNCCFGGNGVGSTTYGEVFTAPITGTMTSFTLMLNTGVGGDLFGGVASWNGTSTPATGDGPTSILYTSSAVASPVLPDDQSYTFMPNISVTTGDIYVAYISVAGLNSPDQGATPNVTNGSSVPGIDYFVYNDSSSFSAPWDYAFLLNNAVFTADFNSSTAATPLPAALPLFAGGLGVIGLFGRRRKRKAADALAA
jgi:hypothetical protein